MTLKEKMEQMLYEHGMFSSQVKEVMEMFIASKETETLKERWNHQASDYEDSMIRVMFMVLKIFALEKYIKPKCPEAWFRPMFEAGGESNGS